MAHVPNQQYNIASAGSLPVRLACCDSHGMFGEARSGAFRSNDKLNLLSHGKLLCAPDGSANLLAVAS
ncbi:MAG: hypothetical protein ACJLS3_13055 [Erythrobacter sp.]